MASEEEEHFDEEAKHAKLGKEVRGLQTFNKPGWLKESVMFKNTPSVTTQLASNAPANKTDEEFAEEIAALAQTVEDGFGRDFTMLSIENKPPSGERNKEMKIKLMQSGIHLIDQLDMIKENKSNSILGDLIK